MISLEDNFADVLGKAVAGLGLTEHAAAAKAGLAPHDVQSLLSGEFCEEKVRTLASALALNAEALVRLGRGEYHPDVTAPRNLACVTTDFQGMSVNAYVLWDPNNHDAAIFDTGADATAILDIVQLEELNVLGLFLTHSHADHIHALAKLKDALGIEAWSSVFDPVRGTRTFRPGDLFTAGCHFIRTRHTSGHSPGGATFVIEGAEVGVAIVGDALFAGSIGGARNNYEEALTNIRREIMTLPDDTVLCPGHGPLTTVGLEKANNPFL